MTSVLKKSRGTKGKSESMQEDLPVRWYVPREHKSEDAAKLIKYIDDSIIGKGTSFCGPFGRRKVLIFYCETEIPTNPLLKPKGLKFLM
ncbi:unnamed protein product [Euphydryas editha]|uniref:Uncharacterized protein n=1 Tax=Euphydryas editha TaxID=104508 RepID=A0AAU9TQF9_EUPED|nr:unnamed protein product [Euphydryas editha]